ncbi:MAG: 5'-methylthioadenosine phosphorylase [Sulfobacillus thermosulfidooxidans]|nr:MAG: 5'-methylthioadenosine phosphorylase [Sulfobacillus thermosulfidooxidans]
MRIAVIGGTGVYDPTWLSQSTTEEVATPFGPTRVTRGHLEGMEEEVFFMNRHGAGHKVPPHLVNYRANIWALRELGVDRVVATAAVGSLNVAMPPGAFILCDQFLDFTKARASTFHNGGESGVVHTDMTEPYCPDMRSVLVQKAKELGIAAVNGGCYVTTDGPRFETPAEIKAYRLLGGDVVGMTGVPEVVLARELGLCYSTVALVTNFAAGISSEVLSHQEVLDVMAQNVAGLRNVIAAALPLLQHERTCACSLSAH